jgi:hypothetical protein
MHKLKQQISILAGSTRGKKFLPQHTQFALMQHRMVPKYEENNTNDQFLYFNVILSHQPINKQ